MTDYNNGGPAFPITAGNAVYGHGMTLRDWFAGQALAGIMTNSMWVRQDSSEVVLSAYRLADAMIVAREK